MNAGGITVRSAELVGVEGVRFLPTEHRGVGVLTIAGSIPAMGPFVLPGNNYHVYDYALFWGAIARDSVRRVQAWTSR